VFLTDIESTDACNEGFGFVKKYGFEVSIRLEGSRFQHCIMGFEEDELGAAQLEIDKAITDSKALALATSGEEGPTGGKTLGASTAVAWGLPLKGETPFCCMVVPLDQRIQTRQSKTRGAPFELELHPPCTVVNMLRAQTEFEFFAKDRQGNAVSVGGGSVAPKSQRVMTGLDPTTPLTIRVGVEKGPLSEHTVVDISGEPGSLRGISTTVQVVYTKEATEAQLATGTVPESNKLWLQVEVTVQPLGAGIHVMLYAPYVVSNKTELPLVLRENEGPHQQVLLAGGEMMFAFPPGTKDERCVLSHGDELRPEGAGNATTDPFDLDTTLDGVLVIPGNGAMRKPVHLALTISGATSSSHGGGEWRLRQIEIVPRFVVTNATGIALEMKVDGMLLTLEPNTNTSLSAVELKQGTLLAKIRISGNGGEIESPESSSEDGHGIPAELLDLASEVGGEWTPAFWAHQVGVSVLRIPGREALLQARVKPKGASTSITITDGAEPRYGISNQSGCPVVYKQHYTGANQVEVETDFGPPQGIIWGLPSETREMSVKIDDFEVGGGGFGEWVVIRMDHLVENAVIDGSSGPAAKYTVGVQNGKHILTLRAHDADDEIGTMFDGWAGGTGSDFGSGAGGSGSSPLHGTGAGGGLLDGMIDREDEEEDEEEPFEKKIYSASNLSIQLPSFGISLLDLHPREILYLQARGCSTIATVQETFAGDKSLSVEVMARSIQMDNKLTGAPFPVLFSGGEDNTATRGGESEPNSPELKGKTGNSRNAGEDEEGKPWLVAMLVQDISDPFASVIKYEQLSISLQPMTIAVDEMTLSHLHRWGKRLGTAAMVAGRGGKASSKSSAPEAMLYFELLELHPIRISVHLPSSQTATNMESDPDLAEYRIQKLLPSGMSIPAVDGAPICLNALIIEHTTPAKSDKFAGLIAEHYARQFMAEAYKVVGSVSALGNPVGLVDSMGTGVKDFFYEPASAINRSPAAFGKAIHQ